MHFGGFGESKFKKTEFGTCHDPLKKYKMLALCGLWDTNFKHEIQADHDQHYFLGIVKYNALIANRYNYAAAIHGDLD